MGTCLWGIVHWCSGNFRGYEVNPPLVRLVAALPVLSSPPAQRFTPHGGDRPEWALGREFIDYAGEDLFGLFHRARLALLPLLLIGPLALYRLGERFADSRVGFAAAALYCFSPTVLAYSALCTPDAVAASLTALSLLCLCGWLDRQDWGGALALGVSLGVTLATKFTGLLLIPAVLFAAFVYAARWPRLRSLIGQLFVMAAVVVATIGATYGFEGIGRPLGTLPFRSKLFGGPEASIESPHNRFRHHWIGRLPLPVPERYVLGIDRQQVEFETGYWSYVRGHWRRRGWWWYYAYAALVKEPAGYLVMLLIGFLTVLRRGYSRFWVVAIVPSLLVFLVLSAHTAYNHHYRYVLPALPGIYLIAAMGLAPRGDRVLGHLRWLRLLSWGCLVAGVLSSLSQVPHSESYFNWISGGPYRDPPHLLDSNIDWGQDLLPLKRWLDRHPEVVLDGTVYYSPFARGLLRAAGLPHGRQPIDPARPQPDGHKSQVTQGTYAVFVRAIYEHDSPFRYLRHIEPRWWVTPAVRIYVLSPELVRAASAAEASAAKRPAPGG